MDSFKKFFGNKLSDRSKSFSFLKNKCISENNYLKAFTNCISEINNTQIDNAKDIDIVMPMYNLIEYSDNYAKTTGSVWQYCKDIPARNNNNEINEFTLVNTTDSFKFKAKITG